MHEIYNVTDDEPAPPQDVVAYAAELLHMPPPPEIAFEDAQLSPMAASFYADNKRIRNTRLRQELGVALKFPTYREGLRAILAEQPERLNSPQLVPTSNAAVQPPFKQRPLYWRNPVALLPRPLGAPGPRRPMLGEDVMRSAVSGLSRGAVCAVALISWMYSPNTAVANDDAAHALAEKFSQAGEESKRAAEAKAAKVRAKARSEGKSGSARRQAEAAKRQAAEQRAADEAEMLRTANEEAEARRKHDQQREQALIEAERQAARAEAQRLADEA